MEHDRAPDPGRAPPQGDPAASAPDQPADEQVDVQPVFILSRTFAARPSTIPEIRDFVQRSLADSPLTGEGTKEVQQAVFDALLDAAGPGGGAIQVSFRFTPDSVEVDVLRSPATAAAPAALPSRVEPKHQSFAEWLAAMLKREGLSQEAAARQLGVSVKTVSRWVGGETEPRLKDLRRIREIFGQHPMP